MMDKEPEEEFSLSVRERERLDVILKEYLSLPSNYKHYKASLWKKIFYESDDLGIDPFDYFYVLYKEIELQKKTVTQLVTNPVTETVTSHNEQINDHLGDFAPQVVTSVTNPVTAVTSVMQPVTVVTKPVTSVNEPVTICPECNINPVAKKGKCRTCYMREYRKKTK